jgi:hypothetical protein
VLRTASAGGADKSGNAATASDFCPIGTWLYRLMVRLISECRMRDWATFGCAPVAARCGSIRSMPDGYMVQGRSRRGGNECRP